MATLVLYILETALAILKASISGAKVDIPAALVRIIRAGYQAYEAHTSKALNVADVRPYDRLEDI
jgi:hypothetical protein